MIPYLEQIRREVREQQPELEEILEDNIGDIEVLNIEELRESLKAEVDAKVANYKGFFPNIRKKIVRGRGYRTIDREIDNSGPFLESKGKIYANETKPEQNKERRKLLLAHEIAHTYIAK